MYVESFRRRQILKKYLKDYSLLFLIAGIIVLLDQVTKQIVRANLAVGEVYRPDLWISQFARILNWKNTGAAFGMFQNGGLIFTILAFVVSGAILYYYPQIPRQDRLIRISMGFLLGGAVGNLIDRLTQGLIVTDFISIWIFPVFNLADLSITIGVVILCLGMIVQERRNKALARQAASVVEAPEQETSPQSLPEE
jgi:signal peptidase II